MNREELNSRVDKTLESLDNIERASPGPYFFTRLEARMNRGANQARNFWERSGSFLAKPVVALGGVLVIAMINLTLIFSAKDDSINNITEPEQSQYAANDEYVQLTNSAYEIENIKP